MDCPICNGRQVDVHHRYLDMIIARCGSCDFLFQPEESAALRNRAIIEQVYREYLAHGADHEALNAPRLDSLLTLTGIEPVDARALEIGPGTGALGHLMLERGIDYRAVEPLETCYEALISRYPEMAERVEHGPFRADLFEPRSFDLVVMTDCLEHVQGPLELLGLLGTLLAPEGRLYIEVPNESIFPLKAGLRRLFGMYGRGYPTNPEHASLFTPASLGLLLERAGFLVDGIRQQTVWGDPRRMRIAFNGHPPATVVLGNWIFKLTKLDLLLGQGILVATGVTGPTPCSSTSSAPAHGTRSGR